MTLLAGIIQIGILYIFYLAGSKLTELLHLPIREVSPACCFY